MEIPTAKVLTKNQCKNIDVLTHCVIISTLENNENDENNEIEELDINDEDYTVCKHLILYCCFCLSKHCNKQLIFIRFFCVCIVTIIITVTLTVILLIINT